MTNNQNGNVSFRSEVAHQLVKLLDFPPALAKDLAENSLPDTLIDMRSQNLKPDHLALCIGSGFQFTHRLKSYGWTRAEADDLLAKFGSDFFVQAYREGNPAWKIADTFAVMKEVRKDSMRLPGAVKFALCAVASLLFLVVVASAL